MHKNKKNIHTSITFFSLTADKTEFEAAITASICLIDKQNNCQYKKQHNG